MITSFSLLLHLLIRRGHPEVLLQLHVFTSSQAFMYIHEVSQPNHSCRRCMFVILQGLRTPTRPPLAEHATNEQVVLYDIAIFVRMMPYLKVWDSACHSCYCTLLDNKGLCGLEPLNRSEDNRLSGHGNEGLCGCLLSGH